MPFRPRRARRAPLALAVAVASLVASAPSAPAATTSASTSGRIGLFCPCWGTVPSSYAEWDEAARNHSVIAGMSKTLSSRIGQLHRANPNLVVLVYNLGPYLARGSAAYEDVMRNHPEYFARTTGGRLITVKDFPLNTLMDQGNPGWRAYHTRLVARAVTDGRFDGAYVDSMGPAAVGGTYTTGLPVNKATGRVYTVQQWLNDSVRTLNAVKASLGSRYVMFNGIVGGNQYWAHTRILTTSNADGAMAEAFVRPAHNSISSYPSAASVKSEVDMMLDMASRGVDFFGWTKTWTAATESQRKEWNRFALGVYLLGKAQKSYYNFIPSKDVNRAKLFYGNQKADLGAPMGRYTSSNGTYTRQFQNGRVTVDPAGRTAAITWR